MNDSSGMQNGLRGQSEINNTDGPSAQTLFNTIIRAVRDALQEIHLTYDNINAFDASIERFQGRYAGSVKEPDMGIVPEREYFPTVAIESGWSQRLTRLNHDIVVAHRVSWKSRIGDFVKMDQSGREFVKGKIETWDMDSDSEGSEVLLQREEIFPEPQTGGSDQVIRVSKTQLFGSTLPAGRNPDDVFGLSVSNLRSKVAITMQHDGCRPASSTNTIKWH
ncbi:hypothetical protein I7I51_04584 [Histoplasma capsulatum]|uniref:Uncharacterized protein n=1 Tax=Ajellomyces capsulatus TaxID=5037 RepID=A0A8A1M018_AJECA|nr:hypothetical protein I7I51_04584 [Histoplasma capsulatum]